MNANGGSFLVLEKLMKRLRTVARRQYDIYLSSPQEFNLARGKDLESKDIASRLLRILSGPSLPDQEAALNTYIDLGYEHIPF